MPGEDAEILRRFCDAVVDLPERELAALYREAFACGDRLSLSLSSRGGVGAAHDPAISPVRWERLYRLHGWRSPVGEAPDFLPSVLEFTACRPVPGRLAMEAYLGRLDLLRVSLSQRQSPYADVLAAVCTALRRPPHTPRSVSTARRRRLN
ncbi:nitrate reductase [Streptomyces sp. NBC_01304]|uniref:nitrate reductase n=1 Tax=Streptomyces sp. NBC_01304 TaxID=2903818 RepID=UPI002E0E42C9|nr:nitrate reductase [Streptomyces sp. NBC_01304]